MASEKELMDACGGDDKKQGASILLEKVKKKLELFSKSGNHHFLQGLGGIHLQMFLIKSKVLDYTVKL